MHQYNEDVQIVRGSLDAWEYKSIQEHIAVTPFSDLFAKPSLKKLPENPQILIWQNIFTHIVIEESIEELFLRVWIGKMFSYMKTWHDNVSLFNTDLITMTNLWGECYRWKSGPPLWLPLRGRASLAEKSDNRVQNRN